MNITIIFAEGKEIAKGNILKLVAKKSYECNYLYSIIINMDMMPIESGKFKFYRLRWKHNMI